MKKLKFCIVLLFSFFIAGTPFFSSADTGTYKILDYRVKLTPLSDGRVEIDYYQKWQVTGGHIPWITIGLPNSSYQIDRSKNSGNIKSINSNNSSGWSGVRIDLDKDYRPNDSFEVGFSIIQNKLFYADNNNYKLDFTPGWYEGAVTERLEIIIFIFARIDQVTANPKPLRIEGQNLIWEKLNLNRGARFSVSISFPKNLMPQANERILKSSRSAPKSPSGKGKGLLASVVVVLFIILVVIICTISIAKNGYGGGGGIFYGGHGRGGGDSPSGRSTSGGGGFGGRSFSCVCACVSCACACACAGGGGAGCSKKNSHSCPLCRDKKTSRK